MIELSGVRFRYPEADTDALESLELSVGAGEAVGIAGRSGCGKTTLVKLLAGVAPRWTGGSASGSASIAGARLPITAGDLADRVGYVPQDVNAGIVAERVEDELAFTGENLGLVPAEIRRRIDEVAGACGIGHLLKRRVQTLSGGERQRVQLAAALVARPPVLLLDEPTSQLDPDGVRAVAELLAHLRERFGTGMLAVEHRLERLSSVVDRIHRIGGVEPAADPLPSRATRRGGERTLAVRGVTVELDGCRVLEDVAFEAHAGEVVALVGPNGAGKTTLLRALLGFQRPTTGGIEVSGTIAWVPQRPEAAFCRERVRDEVALTLRGRGVAGHATRILAEHGLETFADRSPRHLSAGERLRVALCALTAGDPRIVLLDEPTRGLDRGARHALCVAIDRWSEQGGTVVLATHDAELIARCDRIVGLDHGRIQRMEAVG